MSTKDLPDIYVQAQGPQAQGRGHIYQANPKCPYFITNIYHFQHYKNLSKPEGNC